MSLRLNPAGNVDIVRINDNLINIKMLTKVKLSEHFLTMTLANDEELQFYTKDADTTIGELVSRKEYRELYDFFDIRVSYIEVI